MSENAATCVTFSSNAKTARRSPGRNTWRIKWAAASCSKLISLWALRLESIMMARSSGCEVSDSNLAIFCSTRSEEHRVGKRSDAVRTDHNQPTVRLKHAIALDHQLTR